MVLHYVPSSSPPMRFPSDSSGANFSPLIIAILGVFASVFLLVSYYTLISKYCGNTEPARRESAQQNLEFEGSSNSSSIHEPWQDSSTGLDETLIKSITVGKFKKGNGLVEGTCSVCLSEFLENEDIRLLPMCTHPFHIPCIDTWLRTHSNCPLCRSSIAPIHASSIEVFPSAMQNIPPRNGAVTGTHHVNEYILAAEHLESSSSDEESIGNNAPSTIVRASTDLGSLQRTDTVIDIEYDKCPRHIERSISMDNSFQLQIESR